MPLEIMNIGFGNMVSAQRIIAVTRAGSAPVRRMIDSAAKSGRLVDATNGRRTRAVIVTDSNHIVLSHLNPQTIGERLTGALDDVLARGFGAESEKHGDPLAERARFQPPDADPPSGGEGSRDS